MPPETDDPEGRHPTAPADVAALEHPAQVLFDLAPVPMQLSDEHGHLLHVNPATARLFGLGDAELVGLHVSELTHPEDVGEDRDLYGRLLAGELDRYSVRKRYVTGYGEVIHALATIGRYTPGPDGRPRLLGHVQDLTHLPGFIVPAERTSLPDPGRPQWATAAFRAALDARFAACRSTGSPGAVIVLDLRPSDPGVAVDGSDVAPAAQHRAIGKAIREVLEPSDRIGRLDRRRVAIVRDGDELDAVRFLARRLVRAVLGAQPASGPVVPLRVTAAVASMHGTSPSAEALVARATRVLLGARGSDGGAAVVDVQG